MKNVLMRFYDIIYSIGFLMISGGIEIPQNGQTLKQFGGKLPTNCLSVFGHFINLVLKGLNSLNNRSEIWGWSLFFSNCFARFSAISTISKTWKTMHVEVLLLVKFQADTCNVTKSNNRHGCFSANLNPLVPGVH